MENLRGLLGAIDYGAEEPEYGFADEDVGHEPPPSPIGQDERRMQVRAYNHWASLLVDRSIPSIEDLDPVSLPDFGPYSVLLDFSHGIDDPAVRYLGTMLAEECEVPSNIQRLSDVPGRSLLTRITDHYMQILANQAPIGFEAEFVNQRGRTIMYRGILLPYSSDDDTIDFIYGVINWKEVADQLTSDELLLEIDQALETSEAKPRALDPVTDWADGPGSVDAEPTVSLSVSYSQPVSDDPFPLPTFGNDDDTSAEGFGYDEDEDYEDEDEDEEGASSLYEAIEAVDDEPEGPSRFASLLTLGGGSSAGSFDDDDDEDYGDEDPVAKWLARAPTPLEQLPEDEFGEPADPVATVTDYEPLTLEAPVFDAAEPVAEDADEPFELVAPVEDAIEDAPFELEVAFGEPVAEDAPFELVDMVEQVAVESEPFELVEAVEPVLEHTVADIVPPAPVEAFAPSGDEGLYDCLAEARELALAASSCEDRSRTALYAAVGRAYDFSLAAQAEPEEFAEIMEDSGLTMQDRAPMTPVVKLVFGADYDKTRLTEYAAVLTHAHRVGIERGTLADFLGKADGGLKGVVQAERAFRRADDGEVPARETPREALARKLRAIAPLGFEDIDAEGEEFALVMIRRVGGEVVVLGEIADTALVEKAARKLVA
ncbi:PAS domain-containing protein [Tsuneonella sp. HG094]